MRKLVCILTAMTVIGFFSTVVLNADHPTEHPTAAKKSADVKSKVEPATSEVPKLQDGQALVKGAVICTACDLKKSKGAKSQCSIYGCSNSIKVKEVSCSMNPCPLKDAVGKVYNILANDKSAGLLKEDYKGKDVVIVGMLYPDENVIEVEFVKLAK